MTPRLARLHANRGLPAPIVRVKPWRAVVLPGDDLARVATRFGGTLEELIGANLLTLEWYKYPGVAVAVPRVLFEGTELYVPAWWPEPYHAGQLGDGPQQPSSVLPQIVAAFSAAWSALLPGQPLPAGVSFEDVSQVLLGWWGHAQQQMPAISKLAVQLADPAFADTMRRMLLSAVQFLQVTGISPETARSIPWSEVPWAKVPWAQIRSQVSDTDGFWAWFGRLSNSGVLMAPVHRPRPDAGSRFQLSGAVSAGGGADGIDFASTDWSKSFLGTDPSDIPWMLSWASVFWGVFADGVILQCVSSAPSRLSAMWACKDCYADAQTFKDVLCDPARDVCFCHVTPQPPTPQPPTPQPPTPRPPAVPNWNCSPFPACLAETGNWPADWPKPCEPFPSCMPDWLRSQNLPVPGEKKAPEPNKSDTTVWWVIGGTLVVLTATGLVAFALTRPSAREGVSE